MGFWERKVGSYAVWFIRHVLIYDYFIVLSYKVRSYPEPFLFYFCKSDYFTLYNTLTQRKHVFLSFFQNFPQKRENSLEKEKQMPAG
jgi:hypothetical protein